MRTFLLAALVVVAMPGPANADTYKCVDAGGKVTYRERACERGTQSTVKLHGNSAAPHVIPSRVAEELAASRGGASSAGYASGTAGSAASPRGLVGMPETARPGMSSAEVLAKFGEPATRDDPTYFHGGATCADDVVQRTWLYGGQGGAPGQLIVLCAGKVVDVKPVAAGSKHEAGPGANRTGLVGASMAAQRGWTRIEVLQALGAPDIRTPMEFSGTELCPAGERVDAFFYAPRGGNLGQTVTFCNNSVVDVRHN